MSDLEQQAKELSQMLNAISDTLARYDIPRSYAGQVVQFDLREGWRPNSQTMYYVSQREQPADYAG